MSGAVSSDSPKNSEGEPRRSQSPKGQLPKSRARRVLGRLAVGAIAAVFVSAGIAGIAALHWRSAAEALPKPHPPVSVQTFTLRLEPSYREAVRYVGQLEPARQTALSFERQGLVTAVFKDEGDVVAAGEVVATLDVAQLQASRKQLQARMRELEARRDLARLTLERQSTLQKKGWSPEQRLDEAEASLAELSAAIDRVAAQIESITIDLQKSDLRAPFDGLIAARSIDEGAVVAPGTPILTVLDAGHRQARIGLPPDVADGLDPGQTYRLEMSGGTAEARLYARRPDLQSGTRTVTALFDVPNEGSTPFGEIVALVLEAEIHEPGAWVPLTALKESDRGLWSVMTVEDKDGETIVRREVAEVLHVDGERAYVRGTFKPDATIISGGTNRLVPGQLVAVAGS